MGTGQRIGSDCTIAETEHVNLSLGFVMDDGNGIARKQRVGKGLCSELRFSVASSGNRNHAAMFAQLSNQPAELFDVPVESTVEQNERSSAASICFVVDVCIIHAQIVSSRRIRSIRDCFCLVLCLRKAR